MGLGHTGSDTSALEILDDSVVRSTWDVNGVAGGSSHLAVGSFRTGLGSFVLSSVRLDTVSLASDSTSAGIFEVVVVELFTEVLSIIGVDTGTNVVVESVLVVDVDVIVLRAIANRWAEALIIGLADGNFSALSVVFKLLVTEGENGAQVAVANTHVLIGADLEVLTVVVVVLSAHNTLSVAVFGRANETLVTELVSTDTLSIVVTNLEVFSVFTCTVRVDSALNTVVGGGIFDVTDEAVLTHLIKADAGVSVAGLSVIAEGPVMGGTLHTLSFEAEF